MTSPGIPGVICPKCNWSDFFKAPVCPRCLTSLDDALFSATGRIVTFTTIRYPPSGFEGKSPYVIALIDLESGPRVIGRIKAKQEEVKIGLTARYVATAEGALEFELA
jgi:uncharacterized OB-fold protein